MFVLIYCKIYIVPHMKDCLCWNKDKIFIHITYNIYILIISDHYLLRVYYLFFVQNWSRWIPIIELLFLYISRVYPLKLFFTRVELLLHGNRLPIAQKENFSIGELVVSWLRRGEKERWREKKKKKKKKNREDEEEEKKRKSNNYKKMWLVGKIRLVMVRE